jgi:hypothetical protein
MVHSLWAQGLIFGLDAEIKIRAMIKEVPFVLLDADAEPTVELNEEELAVQALADLGLEDDPLRPPIKEFVRSFDFYKPELLELTCGSLTITKAYAAKPRFPHEME